MSGEGGVDGRGPRRFPQTGTCPPITQEPPSGVTVLREGAGGLALRDVVPKTDNGVVRPVTRKMSTRPVLRGSIQTSFSLSFLPGVWFNLQVSLNPSVRQFVRAQSL